MIGLLLIAVSGLSTQAWAAIYIAEDSSDEIKLTNLTSMNEVADKGGNYVVLIEEQYAGALDDKLTKSEIVREQTYAGISEQFDSAIANAAKATALEPALLHAVIRIESNYNPHAVSPKGARGLMQLMPDTAKRFQVSNANDPTQNILAGARYLRELHRQFKGDLTLVLAAYNAGPNAIVKSGLKIPPYLETRQYVPKVLSIYKHLLANQQAGAPLPLSHTDF